MGAGSPLVDDDALALVAVAGELGEVFQLFLAFVFAWHGLIAFVGGGDEPEEAQLERHHLAEFFFPHMCIPSVAGSSETIPSTVVKWAYRKFPGIL